jgi:ribose/xylose/arabinose/galactoside ABC-type transport system permease subunit
VVGFVAVGIARGHFGHLPGRPVLAVGGRGAVLGTLLGALIVQTFQSGLNLVGVQSLYQVLAEGILVIAAVALDQWIRKVRR